MEILQCAPADLPTEVVKPLKKMRPAPTSTAHCRILKGGRDNVHNVVDFGKACNIFLRIICLELIKYSQLSLPPQHGQRENGAIVLTLPVEQPTQLYIAVLEFEKAHGYLIQRTQCTGA